MLLVLAPSFFYSFPPLLSPIQSCSLCKKPFVFRPSLSFSLPPLVEAGTQNHFTSLLPTWATCVVFFQQTGRFQSLFILTPVPAISVRWGISLLLKRKPSTLLGAGLERPAIQEWITKLPGVLTALKPRPDESSMLTALPFTLPTPPCKAKRAEAKLQGEC